MKKTTILLLFLTPAVSSKSDLNSQAKTQLDISLQIDKHLDGLKLLGLLKKCLLNQLSGMRFLRFIIVIVIPNTT